jgi:hypothetical protein
VPVVKEVTEEGFHGFAVGGGVIAMCAVIFTAILRVVIEEDGIDFTGEASRTN